MTNDKGILIRNIYYMLSYAFLELKRNNYEDITSATNGEMVRNDRIWHQERRVP